LRGGEERKEVGSGEGEEGQEICGVLMQCSKEERGGKEIEDFGRCVEECQVLRSEL